LANAGAAIWRLNQPAPQFCGFHEILSELVTIVVGFGVLPLSSNQHFGDVMHQTGVQSRA
jgi:hypothetical protein